MEETGGWLGLGEVIGKEILEIRSKMQSVGAPVLSRYFVMFFNSDLKKVCWGKTSLKSRVGGMFLVG